MLNTRSYTGLLNLTFRALTLFFRFLLTFYITRFLGFEQAGIYGLCLGAVGIMPAILGWGLNYFVSRDVVGLARGDALTLVSDRLSVTVSSLAAASILLVGAAVASGHAIRAIDVQICVLIWLETIALDIHMPLIGMNQSTLANVLVFVRTASWVPLCIAASLAWDRLRTLGVVLDFWIVANVAALALTGYAYRDGPARRLIDRDARRMARLFTTYRSWLIYLSDLGLVGSIFLDRYVITFVLGIELTGVYFFYWSLASAVQTLVSTAVVQVALPKLVDAVKRGDHAAWRDVLVREFAKATAISLVFLVMTYLAASILVGVVGIRQSAEGNGLLLLLLAAALFRVCSEVINLALASVGRDDAYAYLNLLGCLSSVLCAYLGATSLSLVGAGWGLVASTGIMLGIRVWVVAALVRRAH